MLTKYGTMAENMGIYACATVVAGKHVVLNEEVTIYSNFFNRSRVCELGVTFLDNGREYKFDFKYDTEKEAYIYERFSEVIKDRHGNEKEDIKLLRDTEKEEYIFEIEALEQGKILVVDELDSRKRWNSRYYRYNRKI